MFILLKHYALKDQEPGSSEHITLDKTVFDLSLALPELPRCWPGFVHNLSQRVYLLCDFD